MAIKVGNTNASLYLGSTPVAAYLGATQVYSVVPSVTLYFNNAEEDADWATVGNWWLDAGHTQPAGRLPAEIDSVVASGGVAASGQTVVNFTSLNTGLAGTLTVTGMATFNDNSANYGTVNGNATFNDTTFNAGTITGTATFTGSACNFGGTAGTFIPNPPPDCGL
jgi:hypothetical protein